MRKKLVRHYFTADEYRTNYLNDPHWSQLKDQLIYSNPRAKCWICGKRNTLLPHHIKYKNLYREKGMFILAFWVFGDIAIVCFDCHIKIHFIKILWLFNYKLPRKKFYLVKRMCYLRIKYCIQEKRFGSALWAFWLCMFSL